MKAISRPTATVSASNRTIRQKLDGPRIAGFPWREPRRDSHNANRANAALIEQLAVASTLGRDSRGLGGKLVSSFDREPISSRTCSMIWSSDGVIVSESESRRQLYATPGVARSQCDSDSAGAETRSAGRRQSDIENGTRPAVGCQT